MAWQATALTIPRRETVSCRVCSATMCTPYFSARGYTIVRCDTCGLRYVSPQPNHEELNRLYASYDDGDQWRNGEERFNRAIRQVVLRYKKEGSALDVGSGSGDFLRCLRDGGFRVFGIEPSQWAVPTRDPYMELKPLMGRLRPSWRRALVGPLTS